MCLVIPCPSQAFPPVQRAVVNGTAEMPRSSENLLVLAGRGGRLYGHFRDHHISSGR